VRDVALDKLIDLLITQKFWFQQDGDDQSSLVKNIRRTWEGLFYSKSNLVYFSKICLFRTVIWHSDKPQYQQQCCQKIASIMMQIDNQEHK
jgi:hypothetical protein